MNNISKIISCIYFVFSILVGTIGLYNTVFITLYKIALPQSWVKTPAVVVYSGIDKIEKNNNIFFKANIRYKYLYNNKEYENNKISMFDKKSNIENINSITEKYPVGKKIFCYVNDQISTDSVIKRNIEIENLIVLLAGIIPLIFLIIGTVGINKMRKKK